MPAYSDQESSLTPWDLPSQTSDLQSQQRQPRNFKGPKIYDKVPNVYEIIRSLMIKTGTTSESSSSFGHGTKPDSTASILPQQPQKYFDGDRRARRTASFRAHDSKRVTVRFPPTANEPIDRKYRWCGHTDARGFNGEDHREEHERVTHLENNMDILRSGVLAASQMREAGLHNALLKVKWDVLAFMKDQFHDNENPNTVLGSVVTISGSVQHAQATTCAEYVEQNWGAQGLGVLEALQDALNSPKHTSQARTGTSSNNRSESGESALSSRAELSFDVSHDEVCVIIKSEKLDVIVSAVSQLAWMGTALRTSANGRVQYCEPKLEEVSRATEAEPVVFNITFVMRSPGGRDQSCWLPLFSNPVIARGFPIPERQNREQGLEVPLEIMAALGGARHVTEFEDGLILKGYSAMFVPTKCHGNSVQWHLICASGEDRIPYQEASAQCPKRAMLGELNHRRLSTARMFLGWWKESQTHLATADVDYGKIDWSKAKRAGSSLRLTGGTVGVSKIISAQMNFVLGAKDGPYHYSQQEPFEKTIDRAERFPIVLYDQKDRRAWLVSALAVILHIIQLRNHSKPFVVGGQNVQISPLDPSRQGQAAREAVAKNKSLKLFDCETNEEKEYCFRDAILDTWSVLDHLMEKEAEKQASPGMAVHNTWQNTLHGWELMDIAEEERHLHHKIQPLEKTAGLWCNLVKDVDAVVLFASGLGDIIRPRPESAELCRKWRSLPKGKDYLAVCVPMVENFYAKAGHRQDHQYLTSAKLQWHLGSVLFEKCADIASDCCQCDRLQQLYHRSHGSRGRRTPPDSLEANGCLVFGQGQHFLQPTIMSSARPSTRYMLSSHSDHQHNENDRTGTSGTDRPLQFLRARNGLKLVSRLLLSMKRHRLPHSGMGSLDGNIGLDEGMQESKIYTEQCPGWQRYTN